MLRTGRQTCPGGAPGYGICARQKGDGQDSYDAQGSGVGRWIPWCVDALFTYSYLYLARFAIILLELFLRDQIPPLYLDFFAATEHPRYELFRKEVTKSRNKEMREMFQYGFGIHHAGMLRSDRNMTERLFSDGLLKVLCCTATLAWGVNLPAYAVVIKGTQIYDTQKGSFVDLSILDVLQIFGRAGRPQVRFSVLVDCDWMNSMRMVKWSIVLIYLF